MLTDLAIRNLPVPVKGVKRYWDKDGLCLQVSQGGTKTFYFVHGADRQFHKLGRYPQPLSLADARDKVRTILAKRTLGIEEEIANTTVQTAIDRFVTSHCETHNKPKTANETKRLLRYLLPIGKRRIAAVKTPDVLAVIDKASSSISERRHLFAAARSFFRWATRQQLIRSSPLQDQRAPGSPSQRARLITDTEMASIYRAADQLGYPYGIICLIAIHTGMRRGEVGTLRWSYITDETITLPAATTKNGREHTLPNLIDDLIARIPRRSDANLNGGEPTTGTPCDLLFPSAALTPYSTWSDGKEALDTLAGVEDFVFHDFRRYVSSTMAKLRVPIDVTEAILNHVTGSRTPIQRIYDRYDRLPEMRAALEVYERHLAYIVA